LHPFIDEIQRDELSKIKQKMLGSPIMLRVVSIIEIIVLFFGCHVECLWCGVAKGVSFSSSEMIGGTMGGPPGSNFSGPCVMVASPIVGEGGFSPKTKTVASSPGFRIVTGLLVTRSWFELHQCHGL
jgi:hypothetical protein